MRTSPITTILSDEIFSIFTRFETSGTWRTFLFVNFFTPFSCLHFFFCFIHVVVSSVVVWPILQGLDLWSCQYRLMENRNPSMFLLCVVMHVLGKEDRENWGKTTHLFGLCFRYIDPVYHHQAGQRTSWLGTLTSEEVSKHLLVISLRMKTDWKVNFKRMGSNVNFIASTTFTSKL